MMKEKVYRVHGHDTRTGVSFVSVHVAYGENGENGAIDKHAQTLSKLYPAFDPDYWVIDYIECKD